jgi:prepilin-type processing-associated H-X9-DG protein
MLPACNRNAHGTSNRVKCASNLRQIGQAILLYSNENKGAYPRTTWEVGAPPTSGTGAEASNPFGEGGPKPNDVTAALFLLLRTQDITSEVFTCPSSNADRDLYGDAKSADKRSNFTDIRKNLSYSYQNPYPDARLAELLEPWTGTGRREPSADWAIAADMNPGLTGNGHNVLAVTLSSSVKDMKQGNSENHDSDGQNVLYFDGHVEWQQNPFVGVERDNIYTVSDGQAGNAPTLLASPSDLNDSILLPTDD